MHLAQQVRCGSDVPACVAWTWNRRTTNGIETRRPHPGTFGTKSAVAHGHLRFHPGSLYARGGTGLNEVHQHCPDPGSASARRSRDTCPIPLDAGKPQLSNSPPLQKIPHQLAGADRPIASRAFSRMATTASDDDPGTRFAPGLENPIAGQSGARRAAVF